MSPIVLRVKHLNESGRAILQSHVAESLDDERKSKSDQHHTAEGWFRFSPDHTLRDFYFRFKSPEEPAKNSSRQFSDAL